MISSLGLERHTGMKSFSQIRRKGRPSSLCCIGCSGCSGSSAETLQIVGVCTAPSFPAASEGALNSPPAVRGSGNAPNAATRSHAPSWPPPPGLWGSGPWRELSSNGKNARWASTSSHSPSCCQKPLRPSRVISGKRSIQAGSYRRRHFPKEPGSGLEPGFPWPWPIRRVCSRSLGPSRLGGEQTGLAPGPCQWRGPCLCHRSGSSADVSTIDPPGAPAVGLCLSPLRSKLPFPHRFSLPTCALAISVKHVQMPPREVSLGMGVYLHASYQRGGAPS